MKSICAFPRKWSLCAGWASSELVVGEEVFSGDDALDHTVARVHHHQVAQVVDPELSEHVLEAVVDGALVGMLDHVGAQVDPLFEVLLDHL